MGGNAAISTRIRSEADTHHAFQTASFHAWSNSWRRSLIAYCRNCAPRGASATAQSCRPRAWFARSNELESLEKKSFTASEQLRADVQAKRQAFLVDIAKIAPGRLVFLDESGCIAMAQAYGRAPAGVRVADSKPANWGGNVTIVGAIKNDRVVCHRTLDGAMNKPRFIEFVREVLCPRLPKRSVVVMDNLRAHHAPEVREAIEAVGSALMHTPPYSPDLNPIEQCWSFTKSWLRRLAKRTPQTLRKAINNTLLRVRTSQLFGWFRHCGYSQRKRPPL